MREESVPIFFFAFVFDSFDFALALPQGSTLREPLNNAILQMREAGQLNEIKERWFGEHH